MCSSLYCIAAVQLSRSHHYQFSSLPAHIWPIRGQYQGHVITLDWFEASIPVTWSLSTNQTPVSRDSGFSGQIRGMYPGHVITLDQSETSIQRLRLLWTNQRPVSSHQFPRFLLISDISILRIRDSRSRCRTIFQGHQDVVLNLSPTHKDKVIKYYRLTRLFISWYILNLCVSYRYIYISTE